MNLVCLVDIFLAFTTAFVMVKPPSYKGSFVSFLAQDLCCVTTWQKLWKCCELSSPWWNKGPTTCTPFLTENSLQFAVSGFHHVSLHTPFLFYFISNMQVCYFNSSRWNFSHKDGHHFQCPPTQANNCFMVTQACAVPFSIHYRTYSCFCDSCLGVNLAGCANANSVTSHHGNTRWLHRHHMSL